jgi:hypothetical protein
LPIAVNLDCSTLVDAGPLRFAVESRVLDDTEMMMEDSSEEVPEEARGVFEPDGGPSVHVFGLEDGLEYLRFDCFESKPHYHYIRHAPFSMTTVTFDRYADGDVIEWTISCLRRRLPEMLEYASASELAAAVRQDEAAIATAIDEIEQLLEMTPDSRKEPV